MCILTLNGNIPYVNSCISCPNPETKLQEEKGASLPVWSGGRNPGPGCLIFHTCANCGCYCDNEWITLSPSASSSLPPCIPYFLFCTIFFPKFSPSILDQSRSRRDLIWVVAEGSGTEKYPGGGFHEMVYVKLSHAMNGNTVCLAECVIVSICCGKHMYKAVFRRHRSI